MLSPSWSASWLVTREGQILRKTRWDTVLPSFRCPRGALRGRGPTSPAWQAPGQGQAGGRNCGEDRGSANWMWLFQQWPGQAVARIPQEGGSSQ